MDLFDNTICAPATRSGGAIAVIRVSGGEAVSIADRIFVPARGGRLADAAGYTLHFGEIRDRGASAADAPAGGELVDEVVVSLYRAPHSYTGEDSVEISCHGSEYIVSRILELLVSNGAKMALPGEFTQRAFVAGKMDLSQAEAVADVIAAQTAAAHRVAMNQLKGGFSDELAEMRAELLHIVSLMELELDFSEEEVEFADRSELRDLLDKTTAHISRLISSFRLGNAIKNGVPVTIAGAANAGKSTLLNAILGEERAIVSDIPGTTRDTVEETFNLDGVLFRFIDTAGLRQTQDVIETLGVERSYEKISAASLILAVADLTSPLADIVASASDIASRVTQDQQLIFVLNKADLVSEAVVKEVDEAVKEVVATAQCFPISAKSKAGLSGLLQSISESYSALNHEAGTTLVTNLRHLDALKSALTPLQRVREGLDTTLPTDLLTQDIREALYHLGSIVGEITTDEILGNIFGHFCIGK